MPILNFHMVGSGGIDFAGAAAIHAGIHMTGRGGIQFGGRAARHFARHYPASGGITFGGAAGATSKILANPLLQVSRTEIAPINPSTRTEDIGKVYGF